jgi:hypothetical protein
MKKINTGRALLGGLVAALIIDMIEGVMHGVVLKADWATAMQALGKSGEVSGAAIGIYNIGGVALRNYRCVVIFGINQPVRHRVDNIS